MPAASLRLCPGGCHALTTGGPCPACARQRDQRRGSAASRGYGRAWLAFRPTFLARLVEAGIAPICGAALPTGPSPEASQCQADGLFTYASADGSSLHFDHEPPLRDDERSDPAKVCDPNRIVLLCAECHSIKTATDTRGVSKSLQTEGFQTAGQAAFSVCTRFDGGA